MAILSDSGEPPVLTDRELRLLERLAQATRPLWSHRDIESLFAAAAEVGRRVIGFDRALVLGACAGQWHARDCGPLADPASDRLRRHVLAAPIPLDPGTPEAAELGLDAALAPPAPSRLASALGLGAHLLAPIAIEGRVVGLLVLDRADPGIRSGEREVARQHATVIGLLLERLLLHARVADVGAELRRLTAFSNALMRESADAPLELPSARDDRVVPFPGVAAVEPVVPAPGLDSFGLTQQELRVASLLAAGNSNRQIAAELVVSPDTVKSHVAHVLAKLGVANRAQAAVLLAQAG